MAIPDINLGNVECHGDEALKEMDIHELIASLGPIEKIPGYRRTNRGRISRLSRIRLG